MITHWGPRGPRATPPPKNRGDGRRTHHSILATPHNTTKSTWRVGRPHGPTGRATAEPPTARTPARTRAGRIPPRAAWQRLRSRAPGGELVQPPGCPRARRPQAGKGSRSPRTHTPTRHGAPSGGPTGVPQRTGACHRISPRNSSACINYNHLLTSKWPWLRQQMPRGSSHNGPSVSGQCPREVSRSPSLACGVRQFLGRLNHDTPAIRYCG